MKGGRVHEASVRKECEQRDGIERMLAQAKSSRRPKTTLMGFFLGERRRLSSKTRNSRRKPPPGPPITSTYRSRNRARAPPPPPPSTLSSAPRSSPPPPPTKKEIALNVFREEIENMRISERRSFDELDVDNDGERSKRCAALQRASEKLRGQSEDVFAILRSEIFEKTYECMFGPKSLGGYRLRSVPSRCQWFRLLLVRVDKVFGVHTEASSGALPAEWKTRERLFEYFCAHTARHLEDILQEDGREKEEWTTVELTESIDSVRKLGRELRSLCMENDEEVAEGDEKEEEKDTFALLRVFTSTSATEAYARHASDLETRARSAKDPALIMSVVDDAYYTHDELSDIDEDTEALSHYLRVIATCRDLVVSLFHNDMRIAMVQDLVEHGSSFKASRRVLQHIVQSMRLIRGTGSAIFLEALRPRVVSIVVSEFVKYLLEKKKRILSTSTSSTSLAVELNEWLSGSLRLSSSICRRHICCAQHVAELMDALIDGEDAVAIFEKKWTDQDERILAAIFGRSCSRRSTFRQVFAAKGFSFFTRNRLARAIRESFVE